MELTDILLRASAATLLLSLSLLLVRDAPRSRTAWLFALLVLGVCGFLARNTAEATLQVTGPPAVAASFLSGNAAIFLWWFVLEIFDDDFRPGAVEWSFTAAWLVISSADRGFLGPGLAGLGLSWVLVALGLALVAHLVVRILGGLEDDLVEPRRRGRVQVASALVLLLFCDLALDIAFGFDWKPRWFTLGQNALVLGFALGLGDMLLRVDRGAFFFRASKPQPRPAESLVGASRGEAAHSALRARLEDLMEERRIYRDPDLTFSGFARLMGAPEAEVRRHINHRLGHRHFRNFLNVYRVAAAEQALLDPSRPRDKVIGVAMDVGFASLASFNRAFKKIVGLSPTEFRAAAASGIADSGRRRPAAASEPERLLRSEIPTSEQPSGADRAKPRPEREGRPSAGRGSAS